MDKIKEMAGKVAGGSSSNTGNTGNTGTTGGSSMDRKIDAAGTKFLGQQETAHGIPANQQTNQKVMDGGEAFIQKQTGRQI